MELLVRDGCHLQPGARPLRKTVGRQLRDALMRELSAPGSARGSAIADPVVNRLCVRRDRVGKNAWHCSGKAER